LEYDIKILVSSANKIGVDFPLINIGKSFIKRRKSKGPSMEQRLHKLFSGTPWVSPQMMHFKYTRCSYWTQDTVLTVTL
jgi:hypothetical protein